MAQDADCIQLVYLAPAPVHIDNGDIETITFGELPRDLPGPHGAMWPMIREAIVERAIDHVVGREVVG